MDKRTTEVFSCLLLSHFQDFSDKIRGKQTLQCKNFDLLLQDSFRFDTSDGPVFSSLRTVCVALLLC